MVSEEEAHTCRVEVETLRRHVPEVLANFDRAAAVTGLRIPGTLEGWSDRIQLWQRVEDLNETCAPAIYDLPLSQIIEAAAPLGGSVMSRFAATLTNAEFRAAKRALRETLHAGKRLSPHELRDAAIAAQSLRQEWGSTAAAPGSAPTHPAGLDALRASYEQIRAHLQVLADRGISILLLISCCRGGRSWRDGDDRRRR